MVAESRVALTRNGELTVPARPQTWVIVCRSDEVKRAHVITRCMLGEPVVVFRTQTGLVHTLAANCAHMGTHLRGGRVDGDYLQCPMHHWTFDGAGVCHHRSGVDEATDALTRISQPAYPTAERFGLVWAFNGPRALFPPPAFDGVQPESLRTTLGTRVRLRCPWFAVAANAFDVQHLRSVHQRALREPAVLERLDPYRLQFSYVARVVGRGVADRTVQRLSNDHVRVSITLWGGTALNVESRLGWMRSLLLLGLAPSSDGLSTDVQPVFAVTRCAVPALDRLHLLGTRWLFTAFLERDVRILDGMRFAPRVPLRDNEPLQRYLELLDELPAADGSERSPAHGERAAL